MAETDENVGSDSDKTRKNTDKTRKNATTQKRKNQDPYKMRNALIVIRLAIFVCASNALDVGTDLVTIYQHWKSSQWFLHYLSVGLMMSLLTHNVLAGLYFKRNWGSGTGIRVSLVWTMIIMTVFLAGFGNMYIAIKVIVEIINKNHVDEQ